MNVISASKILKPLQNPLQQILSNLLKISINQAKTFFLYEFGIIDRCLKIISLDTFY